MVRPHLPMAYTPYVGVEAVVVVSPVKTVQNSETVAETILRFVHAGASLQAFRGNEVPWDESAQGIDRGLSELDAIDASRAVKQRVEARRARLREQAAQATAAATAASKGGAQGEVRNVAKDEPGAGQDAATAAAGAGARKGS